MTPSNTPFCSTGPPASPLQTPIPPVSGPVHMYSSWRSSPKLLRELRHACHSTTGAWIFCKKVALGGKIPVAV